MIPHKDYLLDTNIIRYLVEIKSGEKLTPKSEKVKLKIESNKDAKMFLSCVSGGEIKYGRLLSFERDLAKQKITEDIIEGFEWRAIDKSIAANSYAELRKRLFIHCNPSKKKKRIEQWLNPVTSLSLGIQENDLWIAATAMTYNMILVTDDKMEVIKQIAKSDIEFENWCI